MVGSVDFGKNSRCHTLVRSRKLSSSALRSRMSRWEVKGMFPLFLLVAWGFVYRLLVHNIHSCLVAGDDIDLLDKESDIQPGIQGEVGGRVFDLDTDMVETHLLNILL